MMNDGFPLADGWIIDVQFRRQSLQSSGEPVTRYFDGGETVYVKASKSDH